MTTKKIDDHLSIELEEILGTGLLSIVYKGMYGTMPVAVKKIKYKSRSDAERDLKESKQDRERKVMHLVEKDRHQNVIGYYYSTIDGNIMYLAMQLCHGDLSKYVEDECLMAKYSPLNVNRDIAAAIAYLHENNIAHRDLKPENVFYVERNDTIERIVVGDFGFSKTTTQNMFSYTGSFGTMGYIPYEVWTNIKKNDSPQIRTFMTVKSDIFAMGCIFYFTVCRGRHPFGRAPHHQANIGERNPPDIHTMERAHYNLRHLLIKMLNHEPGERPTALGVSEHPAMWPSDNILNFLKNASDDLESPTSIDRNTRQYLESADVISGDTWFQSLPQKLRKYLNEYRMSSGKYPYKERRDTVSGVLRIIRNIANHYREFPVEVREELGCYPDGHVQLWMRTCPHFFMHVYEKMTELRKPPLVTAETRSELASNMARREHTDTPVVENPDLNPDIGEDTSLISHNLELLKTDEINYVGERRSMDSEDRQIEGDGDTPFISHNLAVMEADNQSRMPVVSKTDPTHSVPTEEQTNVVRQPKARRHLSSDMWMRLAKQEIDEGKKTTVLDQIGQNYILCVDISESMSQNEAWSQATDFVNTFISSLDSVKQIYDGVPIYLSLVTFGHETKVVQRLTNKIETVESAFVNLRLGGPTPMYGGLAIGVATAGIPRSGKGLPHLILITDGRPTETTLHAGGDQHISNTEEEAKSHILNFLGSCSESLDFGIVEVGSPDSEFIKVMASVSGGTVYSHTDGQTILRNASSHGRDMFYESANMSLPAIGSRVSRGLDWSHGDQDSNGPGTIIGHGREGSLSVWVEWDADGHQNCYQYGNNGQYDVLLTDERRRATQTGTIFVGCCVTKEICGVSPSITPEIGTVIKVLQGRRRVEVRWNEGTRGTYAFGENDLFEVWPYHHETTARPEAGLQDQARSTIPPIQTAITRPKIKNKNAFPQKPRR